MTLAFKFHLFMRKTSPFKKKIGLASEWTGPISYGLGCFYWAGVCIEEDIKRVGEELSFPNFPFGILGCGSRVFAPGGNFTALLFPKEHNYFNLISLLLALHFTFIIVAFSYFIF